MSAREELLIHLWKEVINISPRDASLDNISAHCKGNATGPFGDTGPAIERMLAAVFPGATYALLCGAPHMNQPSELAIP